MRLVNLGADAPITLSWGRGPFTDEGFYAHNARNKILFGQWQKDEFNYILVSPMMTLFDFVAFSLIGVSYNSIRLVSVIFSVLTILVFYYWVKRYTNVNTAILGVFLLGFNYFYLMHSRLALSEIPMLFFIVVSVLLMDTGKKLGLFFSGATFVIGCLTKSLAIFFILPLGLAWWLSNDKKKIIFFVLGGISVVTLWYLWLVKPNFDEFSKMFRIFVGQRAPRQLSQIIKVFHTEYFAQLPIITILTLLSLGDIFQKVNRGSLKKIEIVATFWFLWGLFFLSLWSYTTQAYFLILLPPMVVLVSLFLQKLWQQEVSMIVQKKYRLLILVLFFISYFIIRYGIIFYARDFFFATKLAKILLEVLTLLAIIGLMTLNYILNRNFHPHLFSKTNIFILSIVIFIIFNFSMYLKWLLNPSYQIRNIDRDLEKVCSIGTVAGSWAPASCLETNLVEFPFWENVVNDKNLTRAIPATHLLLEESDFELGFIKRVYPKILKSSRLIKTYNLYNWKIDLWDVKKLVASREKGFRQ